MTITPKKRFLRFAFPCTYLLDMQKRITKEVLNKLEQILLTNQEPNEEILKTTFKTAYEQLQKINPTNPFAEEAIEIYFLKIHNSFVDTRETVPPIFKEYCKIQEGTVEELLKGEKTKVKYQEITTGKETTREVSRIWIPELKLKDKVRIHYFYAVEKIE